MNNCEIYERLSKGENVEGLEVLPIHQILDNYREIFMDWQTQNDQYFEKDNQAFEITVTGQFLRCDCYSLSEETMNKIIDIMLEYDCPLYDSSIDVRFDG